MRCKLFVFRHAQSTDNARNFFSGWSDPDLTENGLLQAQQTAEQLKDEWIDYAFTSYLKRARKTLEIVLRYHPGVPMFIDDRLIERCYGLLQGTNKLQLVKEKPVWTKKVHRDYETVPPEGESIRMVTYRTISFFEELKAWLRIHPGNVAISCHGNSMRPIRRMYEHLSIQQMLQIENPQDRALEYALSIHEVRVGIPNPIKFKPVWRGIRVPDDVCLATDPRNPLIAYY